MSAIATPFPTRSDFADWLSPMLVKELRQGLRSRAFIFSFLLLQGAMLLLTIAGLANVAEGNANPQELAGFFWAIIGVPLTFIMPFSGLNAVTNESTANTLELIFLTRLTARRILLGKWVAILAQSTLLVCAVLPYAVLRYFLGSVNLVDELTTLVTLWLSSALLSAACVGFSPFPARLIRALFVMGFIVFGQSAFVFFAISRIGFGGGGVAFLPGSSFSFGLATAAWLLFAVLAVMLVIETGAAKIAPAAENHSTPIRLLGLAGLGAACAVLLVSRSIGEVLLVMSIIVLALICIGILCEQPLRPPRVYRAFTRFGLPGRIAGRFLYPGWPSGVLYVLLVAVLAMAGAIQADSRHFPMPRLLPLTLDAVGSLLLPVAYIRIVRPRTKIPGILYFVVQGVCALLLLVINLATSTLHIDAEPFAALLPQSALFLLADRSTPPSEVFFSYLVSAAAILLLLLKIREPFRQLRKLERVQPVEPPAKHPLHAS